MLCEYIRKCVIVFILLSSRCYGLYHRDDYHQDSTSFKIGNIVASTNCRRECTYGAQPKLCYFKFHLEHYNAMGVACGACATGTLADCFNPQCITADGVERGVTVFNRQLTGPTIQVCQNDIIIVDVLNLLNGYAATVHWHGLLQRGTQYMDGVPGVTQCAVLPENTFRYIFTASEPGTFFYHGHTGLLRTGGAHGAFIVREPPQGNPHSHLYDFDKYEHVIVISDWNDETPEMFFPGLPRRNPGNMPTNILVNGKGTWNDPVNGRTRTPYEVFRVTPGASYRFRAISAASFVCPIQIQIQDHSLILIETDGNYIMRQPFDTLLMFAGERYSFVLTANQPPGEYWIRFRAVGFCEFVRPIEQFALLVYDTVLNSGDRLFVPSIPVPEYANSWPVGVTVNGHSCNSSETNICITDLRASYADQELLMRDADLKLYFGFGMSEPSVDEFFGANEYNTFMAPQDIINIGMINNISFTHPSSPKLTQWKDTNRHDAHCSKTNLPRTCIGKERCYCYHAVKIPMNALVEIILGHEDSARLLSHSFHLHGYNFYVIEEGLLPNKTTTQYSKKKGQHFEVGPIKDTIAIKPMGFVRIKFRADNPGLWLLHCHFEWHTSSGMAVILQVGEHYDLPPKPIGFPTCGNFLPTLEVDSNGYPY